MLLIAIVVGFVIQFFFKEDHINQYGMLVLGLGIAFYGMSRMQMAVFRAPRLNHTIEFHILGVSPARNEFGPGKR